ncbi:MltA domain-containing protein [Variovorax dokdonensis]|uniref:peptidoglycan lytic exotransglycosylase n=1 Tax=Variovorax dokdonensis TaxID=344883 RepID=A0ABT7N9P6_9BURK|nr:MltA domain-containing protein [Variovorax dokdonensis]MDM0044662.1 MltA domain-containing protein [Variovorax dokdonensis]
MKKGLLALWVSVILATLLVGCGTVSPTAPPAPAPSRPEAPMPPLGGSLAHPKSRWVPVDWSELPGLAEDPTSEAWTALISNCTRPNAAFAPLCGEVRQMLLGDESQQRAWLMQRLQPYRVEALNGQAAGKLTSYYEPIYDASRRPDTVHTVPIYAPPVGLSAGRPWFTRQQIDTLAQAQSALRGREIAWMRDPIDALMLHIQGSGRLRITEPDGTVRLVRMAFAGTNEQPYRSVNQWLLSQGVTRITPWPDATKDWVAANPQRLPQLLWSNPRYVFFREEPMSEVDAAFGPRGAQGVPLTAGRSIAVDRDSIPYGTPVWLASSGPTVQLRKLVVAQDTGSAITGAVRADYFAGTGPEAGKLAAAVDQPLRLWVLWPK